MRYNNGEDINDDDELDVSIADRSYVRDDDKLDDAAEIPVRA